MANSDDGVLEWRGAMRVVLNCGALLAAGMAVAAAQEPPIKSAGRTAYQYMVEEVEVHLTRDGAKTWVGRRSDGRNNEYEEVGTTDEYVELRSVQTKNLMRLHADRIRLSKDDGKTWTPWY